MKSMNSINIIIAGLGTVGSSFIQIIEKNKYHIPVMTWEEKQPDWRN